MCFLEGSTMNGNSLDFFMLHVFYLDIKLSIKEDQVIVNGYRLKKKSLNSLFIELLKIKF